MQHKLPHCEPPVKNAQVQNLLWRLGIEPLKSAAPQAGSHLSYIVIHQSLFSFFFVSGRNVVCLTEDVLG